MKFLVLENCSSEFRCIQYHRGRITYLVQRISEELLLFQVEEQTGVFQAQMGSRGVAGSLAKCGGLPAILAGNGRPGCTVTSPTSQLHPIHRGREGN